jgi:hypothetical protein
MAIERDEMLLADCVRTSVKQPFSLVAVDVLQAGKYADITGLQLVGGVRGEATQDDVVLETKLYGFEGLVRPEAVGSQITCDCLIGSRRQPWLLSCILGPQIRVFSGD